MKFLKTLLSRLREPITSLLGLLIVVITVAGVNDGRMTWQWEGVFGVCLGAIFFLLPDKVVILILEQLQKLSDKFLK